MILRQRLRKVGFEPQNERSGSGRSRLRYVHCKDFLTEIGNPRGPTIEKGKMRSLPPASGIGRSVPSSKQRIGRLSGLVCLVLLLWLGCRQSLWAQQKKSQSEFSPGLSVCISHRPEEADLSDAGGGEDIDKFELFFDWGYARLGFNMSNAQIRFGAYNKNWLGQLKKNTTYLAFRLASESAQSPLEISAYAGLAYIDATFRLDNSTSSSSSVNLGYIAGGGVFYDLGKIAVGPQLSIISATGEFEGIKIATGSTQVLLSMKYQF